MISRDVVPRTIESKRTVPERYIERRANVLTIDDEYVFVHKFERHRI
jgi:hypothetical protein